MNKINANHDDKFSNLRGKRLEAERKASELSRTARSWEEKVKNSQTGSLAFEMAQAYDKIADSLNNAHEKSKNVLDSFQKANQTLVNLLNDVDALNQRNIEFVSRVVEQTSAHENHETEFSKLYQKNLEVDSNIKSLNREIEKIDSWVNKNQANNQILNGLQRDVESQEAGLKESQTASEEYISKINSLVSLQSQLQPPASGQDSGQATNQLASVEKSIEDMKAANEDLVKKATDLGLQNHDFNNKLDAINKMVYDLKLLIESTRDIANEIKVAVKFSNSTVLRLRNPPTLTPSMVTLGSLYVKTTQTHTPISVIYNESNPNSYMSLYLKDGVPHFQYRLSDNSPATVVRTPHPINDGNWHKLEIERIGRTAKLIVHSGREHAETPKISSDDSVLFNIDSAGARFYLGRFSFPSNSFPSELREAITHNGILNNQLVGSLDTVNFNQNSFGLWNFEEAENVAGELKRTFDKDTSDASSGDAVHFNADSFLCLPLKTNRFKSPFDVTIRFKANSPDGILWIAKEEKDKNRYISISLEDGYLKVDLKQDSVNKYTLDTSSNGLILNDNKFHIIHVRIETTNGNKVTIRAVKKDENRVDPDTVLGEVTLSVAGRLRWSFTTMCAGGLPSTLTEGFDRSSIITKFIGCIEYLFIPNFNNHKTSLQQELRSAGVKSNRIDAKCSDVINQCSFDKTTSEPTFVSFPAISVEDIATFGISFVPYSGDGTLLFIRQKEPQKTDNGDEAINYIHIYLQNQKVQVTVRNTNANFVLTSSANVENSELNHVYLTKNNGDFTLNVNNVKESRTLSGKERIFTSSDLFVGGVPLSERSGTNNNFVSFHGCIVDVIYKDKSLKFQNVKDKSSSNLAFSTCMQPKFEWFENQLSSSRLSVSKVNVQHLAQQIKTSVKDEECVLSKNFEQGPFKSAGLRFGLTKNSRIEVLEDSMSKSSSSLSFRFRTLNQEGLIFLASDSTFDNYVSIWLHNGYLNYAYSCGALPTHIKSNRLYNDGKYHTVIATRDEQSAILKILERDNTTINEILNAKSLIPCSELNVIGPYYVGGIPTEVVTRMFEAKVDLFTTEPYIGCMSDFLIGHRPLKSRVKRLDIMNCSNHHESGIFFTGKSQTSYASLVSHISMKDSFEIEFDIKPRTKNGLVLYIGPKEMVDRDYAVVELVDGTLQYRAYIGGIHIPIKYTPKSSNNELCSASWITIKVSKDSKGRIRMKVKNDEVKPALDTELISLSADSNGLYIGGLPNPELYPKVTMTQEMYVGCVRDLLVTQGNIKPRKALLDLKLESDVLTYCPLK